MTFLKKLLTFFVGKKLKKSINFKYYCEQYPSAPSCKIYDV
ncbi:MAG: CP12 domain-containing protein [Flavobacteriaceae bacterium]